MDIPWGDVYSIIDGDTFDAQITHYSKLNTRCYNTYERIRIASINAPEIPSLAGFRMARHLQAKPLGRHVMLSIHSRDVFGRLVCDVSITAKSLATA